MPSATANRKLITLLVAGMLITGLWSKWQDMQCVSDCDDPSKRKVFEQPVWQTLTMFLGETLCFIVFISMSSRFFNPRQHDDRSYSHIPSTEAHPTHPHHHHGGYDFKHALLFFVPAACDILGTTCMNVGLLFIPVSIYQMLRGALTLWVALFSFLFLKRTFERHHLISLGFVLVGVAIVGSSSMKKTNELMDDETGEVSPLIGILFVLGAQIFTAAQFVLEEKIMHANHVDPLAAVGYEGVFGSLTTLAALPVLYYFIGSTAGGKEGYFDAPVGFHQVVDNPAIWGSSIAMAISIAFFNFCGLAVTKSVSATARSTIDTCRTLLIWIVSLGLGWESFNILQVLGFTLLVYGTFVFNGISTFPAWTSFHSIAIIASEEELRDEEDEEEEGDIDDGSSTVRAGESETRSKRKKANHQGGETSPLLAG